MSKKEEKVFFPEKNKKRLLKDITEMYKTPLTNDGIFYYHDETCMFKGYVIIFGPKETVYENGVYMFNITYTNKYPFEPPIVKYLTNNGSTRFNPNLYRNGKVCLSMLNTWKGETWTSCQTIRTILLTLITVFNNKPLLNEPGIQESSKDFIPYNKIIEYMNIYTAVNDIITKKKLPNHFRTYWDDIKNHFIKEKKFILKKVEELYLKNKVPKEYRVRIYDMRTTINYKELLDSIQENFKLLN
jgi:ubiquitin-protein ligase